MMMKCFTRVAVICSATFMLAGCSFFYPEKDVVEMAKLPVFEKSYKPVIAWEGRVTKEYDKRFTQMQPAADSKAVYAASRDGWVKAFSATTGALIWSTDFTEDPMNQLNDSPRFSGGVTLAVDSLIIGTENAQVLAFSTTTGELKWAANVSGEVVAQPAYSEGKVVVHTTAGELIALDSETGKQLWTLSNNQPKLTLRGTASPVIANGGVIFGRADGFISVALLETGQPLWQIPVARPYGATEIERIVDVDMKPIVNNGVVYTLAYNGNLVAIDLLKGTQLWSRKYAGFSDIALSGNTLYLTDYRGFVFAIDRKSGAELWVNKQLSYRDVTGVTVANQFLVVGDRNGYLHWLDRDDGHFVARQKIDYSPLYMQPIATDNYLYLQTRATKIVAIEKPSINVDVE